MKILFLASIATKNKHYDGERNKSAAIAESLGKEHKVFRYNLSSRFSQPFTMLRFLIKARLSRYDWIFIAKAPTGCSLAIKYLQKSRVNLHKVILYPYGKGLEGEYATDEKLRNKLDNNAFLSSEYLIAENVRARQSYEAIGRKDVLLFPVVKKIYELPETKENVKQKVLKAIFWARIVATKGVLDAIEAVQQVNAEAGFVKYTFGIAGGDPEEEVEAKIKKICSEDSNIRYFGRTFHGGSKESYEKLQEFDLNIFPTFFSHECAPGSVVDMFIAGVPTLSSKFSGYETMMNENNSYFVPERNVPAIKKMLIYIFDHQEELYKKRALCRQEAHKYSEETFLAFFDKSFKR